MAGSDSPGTNMNTNTAPASAWARLAELQEAIALRAKLSPNPVGPHGAFTVTAPAVRRGDVWGIEVVLDDPNAPTTQTWTGPTLDAAIDAAEAALESFFSDDLPDDEEEHDYELTVAWHGGDAGRTL